MSTISATPVLESIATRASASSLEGFKPFVQAVGRGSKLRRDLTVEESMQALRMIINKDASLAQIGAFLIAQRIKGESEAEIRGFTQVMREEFIQHVSPRVENLLDFGIPYDGKAKTAQLTPAIAIILAACGIPVALHGAEGVPAKKGITPGAIFQDIGIGHFQPEKVKRMIESVGIGFFSAESLAPEWNKLTPLRCEFGLRTAFNSVEKLFNPANAPYQISGFFHGEYLERLRKAQTGSRASWIVQGEEGSIEMATGRATHVFAEDESNDWILDPASVGFAARERISTPPSLAAHTQLNLSALYGESGPALDQVTLTAGVILTLLQVSTDLADGIHKVRYALESGAVEKRLTLARNFR